MKAKLILPAMLLFTSVSIGSVFAQNGSGDNRQAKMEALMSGKMQVNEIEMKQLPDKAKDFISKYFPKDQAERCMETPDKKMYMVYLVSGTKITFNEHGTWMCVKNKDGIMKGAMSAFPHRMGKEISEKYSKDKLFMVCRIKHGFMIKLNDANGPAYYFDKDGKMMSEEQIKKMKEHKEHK